MAQESAEKRHKIIIDHEQVISQTKISKILKVSRCSLEEVIKIKG